MDFVTIKKIIIITEAVIEDMVIQLITAQGAKGYTVYRDLVGKGQRGVRSGIGVMEKFGMNVRIECIVATEEVALSIMEAVFNKFLAKKYAGIAYLEDVRVIRPEKF
jgi:PII-like signaling protein